jgi:hypothetical protein
MTSVVSKLVKFLRASLLLLVVLTLIVSSTSLNIEPDDYSRVVSLQTPHLSVIEGISRV